MLAALAGVEKENKMYQHDYLNATARGGQSVSALPRHDFQLNLVDPVLPLSADQIQQRELRKEAILRQAATMLGEEVGELRRRLTQRVAR